MVLRNDYSIPVECWLPQNTFLNVVLQRSRRNVSFAETVETVSVAEEEHINEDEVSLVGMYYICVCVCVCVCVV